MLLEQIIKYEIREPGPPKTGCFHDKTKIFQAILRVNYYSAYCKNFAGGKCTLLPFTLAKSLTNFKPKMHKFLTCFGLDLYLKRGPNNLVFHLAIESLKFSAFKWL